MTEEELDEITEFIDGEVAFFLKRLFLIHREIRKIMNAKDEMGDSDLVSNALQRIAHDIQDAINTGV